MRNQGRLPSIPRTPFKRDSSCYLESIGKSPLSLENLSIEESKCGRFALLGDDEAGHRFAKSLDCNKEWCKACKESSHNRRFARWLSKAQKTGVMGYLVVTFPEDKRPRDKKRLSWIAIQITRGLKRRGIRRGLRRWHFFGDESNKWNPHLNFLLDLGYLSETKLASIKKMIREVLKISEAVVFYQFTRSKKKIIHWLKYVTRPTFLKREWDDEMADEIYNFRNAASFGKWLDEDKWTLPKREKRLGYFSKIINSVCPICGLEIHWHGIVSKDDLAVLGYEQVWKKTWQMNPPPEKVLTFEFFRTLQAIGKSPLPPVPHRVENNENVPFGGSLGGKAPFSFE